MAASPQARQEVKAIAALAARLKEAAQLAPPVEPSAALCAAVEKRLAELETAAAKPSPLALPSEGERSRYARAWRRRRLAALALTAACLVAFAVPIARTLRLIGPEQPREVAKASAAPDQRMNDATKSVIAGSTLPRPGPRFDTTIETTTPLPIEVGATSELDVDSTLPALYARRQMLQDIVNSQSKVMVSGANPSPSSAQAYAQLQATNERIDALKRGGAANAQTGQGYSALGPRPQTGDALAFGDGKQKGENSSGGQSSRDAAVVGNDRAITETLGAHDRLVEGPRSQDGVAPGQLVETDNKDAPRRTRQVQPVQINSIPGVDVLVIRGIPQDVARVAKMAEQDSGQRAAYDGQGSKPFNDNARPSGYSPWLSLYTTPTTNGTISPYNSVTSAAQPRMGLAGDLQAGMASSVKSGNGALTCTDAQGKAAAKKPVDTWKPARVVPNASRLMVGDKEELPLKGMQVDVRVDGFRARVLLDLYYFNDRPQQLEGNFQLRLPDEAAPYFFAFGRTVYQAPQVTPSGLDVLQAAAGLAGRYHAGEDPGPPR